LPLWSQVQAIPIPGGDVIPPYGLFNQFFPGVGAIYDGRDAEPHGIINSDGVVAMGYTSGTVQDNTGKTYIVSTDIRVYQGTYVGAVLHDGAGGSISATAHGTFVEI
jgi:hypothetical protein